MELLREGAGEGGDVHLREEEGLRATASLRRAAAAASVAAAAALCLAVRTEAAPPGAPAQPTEAPPSRVSAPPERPGGSTEPARPFAGATGGTLTYAAGLPAALNNPNLRGNGWNEATALLYSRLYRVGLTGEIEPDLVEREEVSADGRRWTLHLRPGVVLHDGRPLTPADVKATLDQVMDPDAPCDLDLNLPMVASFEYPDASRVVVALRHPAPLLPVPLAEIAILPASAIGSTAAGMVAAGTAAARTGADATAAGKAGGGATATGTEGGATAAGAAGAGTAAAGAAPAGAAGDGAAAIGTGPYRFVRRRPDGTLEFARHERFHLGAPSIETILLKEIPDDAARAEALARGEVDVAHVKPQHLAGLSVRDDVRIVRMRTGAWRGMPLNLKRPALLDKRVRRAIDLALDREAIVAEALPGGGAPAYQPVPPGSWAFVPEMDRPYRDAARARALLDEAGWKAGPDGLRRKVGAPAGDPLTLNLIVWKDETFRRLAAEAIRRQLREIGVLVRLDLVDNAAYNRLAEAMGAEHDGFIGGWGSLLDPGDNLYKKFHSRGSQNYPGYRNPIVDMMLDECRAATDPRAARPVYRRILERLRDDAVFLPLAYPDYLFGVRTRVRGIEPAAVDSWYEFTRNAHAWKVGF